MANKLYNLTDKAKREFSGLPLVIYAAGAAFFLFVSTLPFLLLLSLLVPRIGIGADQLIAVVTEFTPNYIDDLVTQIILDTFSRSSNVVPIYVITILWSAAMSMTTLGDGLRLAYGVKRRSNFIVARLLSMLYMVVLLILLLGAMLLVMFGRFLLAFTGINRIPLPGFLSLLLQGRRPVFFIVGMMLLLLLYTFFSGKRRNPLCHLPGAVFTLVAWLAFSEGFSAYLNINTTYGTLYGNMSVMVVLLLWLYFSVYILLVGAGINASLQDDTNSSSQDGSPEEAPQDTP